MWADTETDTDCLNYSEVAELVAEIIGDKALLPVSIGVFGGWGTGKSSTLRLVEAQLNREKDRFLIIKYDAWLYQNYDDARAALMSVIAEALVRASPPNLVERTLGLLKRVNKIRLLGLALEGGALAMGLPTFGAVAGGVTALGHVFSSQGDAGDVKAIQGAAKDVQDKAKNLIRSEESKGPPEEIDAFRSEFGAVLRELDKTLVVFIDNIDRCLPNAAIQTLEAIRLFLFLPNTAFVVAADEDMIRHAVSQHFENPAERHVTDYLDKLIQLPVRVPRVGVQEVRAYIIMLFAQRSKLNAQQVELLRTKLIAQLQNSWKGNHWSEQDNVTSILGSVADDEFLRGVEMADRMAPLLAYSLRVSGNPRIVKRMLNVVRMRSSIAKRRSMPIDEAVIAKLALFERCTDAAATEALHNAINSAPGGKPEALAILERSPVTESEQAKLPDGWGNHMAFLRDWAGLEPKLAGVDLRPAVYLARETVPLRISASSLSPVGLKAVETLTKVATIASQAAKDAMDGLSADDASLVMEALIVEMRKNSDWGRGRPEFRGAYLLAERFPSTASLLVKFLKGLQLPRYPVWMTSIAKNAEWWPE